MIITIDTKPIINYILKFIVTILGLTCYLLAQRKQFNAGMKAFLYYLGTLFIIIAEIN